MRGSVSREGALPFLSQPSFSLDDRLRSLVEIHSEGLLLTSMAGRVLEANSVALELLGFDMEEIRKVSFQELLPEEGELGNSQIVRDLLADPARSLERQIQLRRRDGRRLSCQARHRLVLSQGGKGWPLGVWTLIDRVHGFEGGSQGPGAPSEDAAGRTLDLSSLSELAHASRLSAVGELASGLAHELRQPLSSISNYAHGCVRRLQNGQLNSEEFLRSLEQIKRQTNRAADIIQRLREFLQRGETDRVPVDLNVIVIEVKSLLRFEIEEQKIDLHLQLDEALPAVLGDSIQIEQVILNLVHNAIEACATRAEDSDVDPRIVISSRAAGGEVELRVQDNGNGIPSDQLSRIFEPFYTTKPGGMGIGLSISRTILEAHGGRLWSESIPGGGATFFLALPVGD